jgi:hypothetical protein
MHCLRIVSAAVIAVGVAGCAIERAQVAGEAQQKMIGLTKEQVLTCMGPPATKAAEGATEVWSYNSGNDHTQVATFGQSTTTASVYGNRNFASGNAYTLGSGMGVSSRRYCTVNVVMGGGRVSRVNYSGPTGGLLTGGEQCAFAVQNCVR